MLVTAIILLVILSNIVRAVQDFYAQDLPLNFKTMDISVSLILIECYAMALSAKPSVAVTGIVVGLVVQVCQLFINFSVAA